MPQGATEVLAGWAASLFCLIKYEVKTLKLSTFKSIPVLVFQFLSCLPKSLFCLLRTAQTQFSVPSCLDTSSSYATFMWLLSGAHRHILVGDPVMASHHSFQMNCRHRLTACGYFFKNRNLSEGLIYWIVERFETINFFVIAFHQRQLKRYFWLYRKLHVNNILSFLITRCGVVLHFLSRPGFVFAALGIFSYEWYFWIEWGHSLFPRAQAGCHSVLS